MAMHAVYQEPGPGWDPARGRREQDLWTEHAAFMDGLVEEGFVLLGGPLGDGQFVLLVIEAADEAEIRARLAEDPWHEPAIIVPARIEPWEILLDGRQR
jgi:uncharacterized protein YciI